MQVKVANFDAFTIVKICYLFNMTKTTLVCKRIRHCMSGPSLPVPVELVSGDVFIDAPECADAPEC